MSILIGLILLICFIGSLLRGIGLMKRFNESLEEMLLRFFAHYKNIKTKGENLNRRKKGLNDTCKDFSELYK